MKPVIIFLNTLVLVTMLTLCNGWCHGVDGYVEAVSAQCITAMYDDGEPMSYAVVEITAPGSDTPFQKGRTDRNGYFAVKPDTPGQWKAVVSDGMGHRLELDFSVAPEQGAAPQAQEEAARTSARPVSRPMGVAAGLSIIFGISGTVYGWKARRRNAG